MTVTRLCEHADVIEADWGVQEQPSWFGPRTSDWEPIYSDQPDDVPDVIAAREQGYTPAHEAPLWCFIPAIWPPKSRAWVRDRRVRHLTRQCEGSPLERLPWTAADYAEIENDTNALLAELDLPARPAGRIWLLRAPERYSTAQDVLDDIWGRWQASGGTAMATPGFVEYVQSRLREIF